MKRRGFLKGLLALLPAAAVAPKVVQSELDAIEKQRRLHEAFPLHKVVAREYGRSRGFDQLDTMASLRDRVNFDEWNKATEKKRMDDLFFGTNLKVVERKR